MPKPGAELVMGVIDCICDGGMMACCGFPHEDIYKSLHQALLDLVADSQLGLREKGETSAFIEGILKPIEDGAYSYVTGDDMSNFAGESLGDWEALCTEVRAALGKELNAEDRKAAEGQQATAALEMAKGQLAESRKEVAAAKRQLAAKEKAEKAAMAAVEKAEEKLEELETPSNPKKKVKTMTAMKRPARAKS